MQNEEVGLVGQESFPELLRQTSFLASVKNAVIAIFVTIINRAEDK